MTDEDKGWHSTISLGLGVLIGLGAAFLIFKIITETQKQQQLSMQNLQTQTALLQSGYGLYGLQTPIQTVIPQEQQVYQQAPMPLQTSQPTSVANYDNEETYTATRDERGLLLDVKIKRNAKVR